MATWEHTENNKNEKTKIERKQLHGYFKRQTDVIANVKTKIWQGKKRGNLNIKAEILLIAAENNAVKINYIKVIIHNRVASVGYVVTETKGLII